MSLFGLGVRWRLGVTICVFVFIFDPKPSVLSGLGVNSEPRDACSRHLGVLFRALERLRALQMRHYAPREGSVMDIGSPGDDFGAEWHANGTPKGSHFGHFWVTNHTKSVQTHVLWCIYAVPPEKHTF